MPEDWYGQVTPGPDNTFYFDIQPKNLTPDQQAALRTLYNTLVKIRGDDVGDAIAIVDAEDITDEKAKNIRLAKLIKEKFDEDRRMTSGSSEERTGGITVKTASFHTDIIKLAAGGIDIPGKAIQDDLESFILLIKNSIAQGGTTGKPDVEVKYIVASFFSANDFTGDFTAQVRYIWFEVTADMVEVCQGKDSTSITTLDFDFSTTDYTLIPK